MFHETIFGVTRYSGRLGQSHICPGKCSDRYIAKSSAYEQEVKPVPPPPPPQSGKLLANCNLKYQSVSAHENFFHVSALLLHVTFPYVTAYQQDDRSQRIS